MNFCVSWIILLGFCRGISRGVPNYGSCINIASDNTGIINSYIYA